MAPGIDSQIALPDGRALGYRELGDPQGKPVLFFHGWPGSRIQVDYFTGAATPGVRLIGVDRLGTGLSDFKPGSRLLDWPDDIAVLADSLGLGRFAVLAWLGGGAFALACAHRIPERLTVCGLIAGKGPPELNIPYL